jgi:hypothetical protein
MMRLDCVWVILFLALPFSMCKGRASSELANQSQDKHEVLYWAFFNRGNDDLIPNRGRPAEPQRTTAAIEIEIYVNSDDNVVLEYTFYSPANEAVRREVEVGITSGFALRQIAGPAVSSDPQGTLGPIITGDSAWQKRIVGIGREENGTFFLGAAPAHARGLLAFFEQRENPSSLQNLAQKFYLKGVTSLYGVRYDKTTIPGLPPAGTLHFAARNKVLKSTVTETSHIYYTKTYQTSMVLMPASQIVATPISGEIVAQSRSNGEVNLSARPLIRPDKRPTAYASIDRNAINQNRSTRGVRQKLNWSISSHEVRLSARDLHMDGRADPSQFLVKIATTSLAEQGELGNRFFDSISPDAKDGINDTTGDTEEYNQD